MMKKLACNEIIEGVRFSSPVFFDDGVNMFLAANHPAKRYHVAALIRWNIPFLMTTGKKLDANQVFVPKASPKEESEEVSLDEFLEA